MIPASATGCARCGTILDAHFRFCPECGLPASGEGVLSTQIAELRRHVEEQGDGSQGPGWRRYVLPAAATFMLAFVVLLGLVLFNNSLLERLLPPPGATSPAAEAPLVVRWEPEWVEIPGGKFRYGQPSEERDAEIPYPYGISRYEVPNSLWFDFLTSQRSRLVETSLWQESFPRRVPGWDLGPDGGARLAEDWRSYPVRNVSPVAVAEFCGWLTKRLDRRGVEIRMPTQFEWEFAARGTAPRIYPWGDADVTGIVNPQSGGRTRDRVALIDSSAFQVNSAQLAADDTSPFGVVAMGTDVSEWTVMTDFERQTPGRPDVEERSDLLSAARLRTAVETKQLLVAWRGANFSCTLDSARRVARVWWKTQSDPRESRNDVGVRLVKVRVGR